MNCQLKKQFISTNGMTIKYKVFLLDGEWPEKKDIINFCESKNFDGTVQLVGNIAWVSVYID